MSRVVGAGWVALGLLTVGACSDGGGSGVTAATLGGPPSSAASAAPTTSAEVASTVAVPSAPPEPTGVPGIDAGDALCAGWATYAGTVQMLAVGAAFGEQTEAELTIAEMYAAPAVLAAIDAVAGSWPAELAAERTVVLDDVLGPLQRRARKAVDALRTAGLSDDDLAALTAAWTTLLASRDPDDPRVPRPVTKPDVDRRVEAAATAFLAAVPAFSDDPSLLVGTVEYPATSTYLAAACPDLAASGVGDAI